MLTADVAVYRAWRAAWRRASRRSLAGHSLGEYAALVAAGAIAFADALPLVRFRAQAMQDAVPQGVGAMAAIMGLDDAGIAAACAEAAQGQVVEPVNFNAPGQVVIAGHKEAVERAIAAAKAKGAKRATAAAGERAVSQLAAQAGRGAAGGVSGEGRHKDARRRRCFTMSTCAAQSRRTRFATRWRGRPRVRCAGSRRCRRSRPRA